MREAATSVDPLPMNGSSTRSPANVYSSISFSGSSTGNGAGWPTRRALSDGVCHTSSVSAMKSSVAIVGSCGRPRRLTLVDRERTLEPALAGHDHPLGDVSQHRVGRAAERTPCTRAARPGTLLPHDLPAQQQTEPVLQDVDHVGGQAAIRLATEVGDVDGDPAARLEHPDALGEHVVQQVEVLEIRAGHAVAFELLLVLFAGEVRRRRDDQGDRTVGERVHVAGVAAHERLGDRLGGQHGVVVVDHRRFEPSVEPRSVV